MKKLTLLLFVLLTTISSFSATGWWSDFIMLNVNGSGTTAPTGWFWIGDNPSYATQFDGHSFGTVSSLEITGCDMRYWDDTRTRTGGAFYYRIKSSDGNTEIVASVETTWLQSRPDGTDSNNYQGTATVSINLLSGLSPNTTYQLQVWAKSWNGNSAEDSYLNNGGANYVATFTTAPSIPTSLSKLESSLKLSGSNGMVTARFDGDAKVELYSATGQLIRSANVTGEFSENVKSGLYLLRLNGVTHKIVVN